MANSNNDPEKCAWYWEQGQVPRCDRVKDGYCDGSDCRHLDAHVPTIHCGNSDSCSLWQDFDAYRLSDYAVEERLDLVGW